MKPVSLVSITAAALLLGACAAAPPSGPSVMVLPGDGKSFDQFRADDYECRQYAGSQAGATPEQASVRSGVRSAAIGTAVGAAAGALIGGHKGAGVGAGAGLLIGSAAGAGAAQRSSYTLQERYDMAYTQCMYAKGEKVPTATETQAQVRPLRRRRMYLYAPPPPRYYERRDD